MCIWLYAFMCMHVWLYEFRRATCMQNPNKVLLLRKMCVCMCVSAGVYIYVCAYYDRTKNHFSKDSGWCWI